MEGVEHWSASCTQQGQEQGSYTKTITMNGASEVSFVKIKNYYSSQHPNSVPHKLFVISLKKFHLDEICTHLQTFAQFHTLEMLLCITGHNYGHQFHFFANSFDSQSKPSYKPCPWVAQVA
jgi:hypothetical protein